MDSSDANVFYLRPLERYEEHKLWFYARAIGHNILKGMLKNMFREAGIFTDGKSNHSLRATATTRMIDAGLPEKVIMDRTGHHSLDGLKPYSRTTDRQQQQMSAVISCSELMIKDKETTVEKKEEIEEKVKRAVNYYGEMKGCVFKVGRQDKMSLSEHESYIFISEDMNVIKPLLQKSL